MKPKSRERKLIVGFGLNTLLHMTRYYQAVALQKSRVDKLANAEKYIQ